MHDHLSDMVTRIRNGYLAGKSVVAMPHTKLLESVARVLAEEKYLDQVRVEGDAGHRTLILTLLYAGQKPALTKIKRVSKPGIRIYHRVRALTEVLSGLGLSIVSTPCGIMTGRQARRQKLGGEVLLELW